MKTLITFCATLLATSVMFVQITISAPAPAGNEATGKIVEFNAGTSVSLSTEGAQPVVYKLAKGVTYVNARGKIVKAGKMKKDRNVRVHYTKDGNDMVVDKITVVKER